MRIVLALVSLYAFCSVLLPHLSFITAFESTMGVFFRPWDALFSGLHPESGPGKDASGSVVEVPGRGSRKGKGREALVSDWWWEVLPSPEATPGCSAVALRRAERRGGSRGTPRYFAGPRSPVRGGDPVVRGRVLVGFVRRVSTGGWIDVVPMDREDASAVRAEVRGSVAGETASFVAGGLSRRIPGDILIRVPADRYALMEGSPAYTVEDPLTPGVPAGLLVGRVEVRNRRLGHGRDVALRPPFSERDLLRVAALIPNERQGQGSPPPLVWEPFQEEVEVPLHVHVMPASGRKVFRVHAGRERGLSPGDLVESRGWLVARLERVGWFASTARPLLRAGEVFPCAAFPKEGPPCFFSLKIEEEEGAGWTGKAEPPVPDRALGLPMYLASFPLEGGERYPVARITVLGGEGGVRVETPLPAETGRCLAFRGAW